MPCTGPAPHARLQMHSMFAAAGNPQNGGLRRSIKVLRLGRVRRPGIRDARMPVWPLPQTRKRSPLAPSDPSSVDFWSHAAIDKQPCSREPQRESNTRQPSKVVSQNTLRGPKRARTRPSSQGSRDATVMKPFCEPSAPTLPIREQVNHHCNPTRPQTKRWSEYLHCGAGVHPMVPGSASLAQPG